MIRDLKSPSRLCKLLNAGNITGRVTLHNAQATHLLSANTKLSYRSGRKNLTVYGEYERVEISSSDGASVTFGRVEDRKVTYDHTESGYVICIPTRFGPQARMRIDVRGKIEY